MRDLGELQVLLEFGEVPEQVDDAAIVSLEKSLEDENGEQLVLREVLAASSRGIGRKGLLSEAKSLLRQGPWRFGHP